MRIRPKDITLFILLQLTLLPYTSAKTSSDTCYYNCVTDFLVKINKLNKNIQDSMLFFYKDKMSYLDITQKSNLDEILELLDIQRTAKLNKQLSKISCKEKTNQSGLVNFILSRNKVHNRFNKNKTNSKKRLFLKGDNFKYQCGFTKILKSSMLNSGDITKAIKETNFDPCCLPEMSFKHLGTQENMINGFSVGAELGGGVSFAGYDLGLEFVMIQTGPNSIQVGVVSYNGPEVAISLPLGRSLTQAVLTGKCKSIDDYLGHFSTVGVGGYQQSTGMSDPLQGNIKFTGCNSDSLISGTSTDLIGAAYTYYAKASEFITLKGPRIKRLLEVLNKSNNDSIRRKRYADRKEDFFNKMKSNMANFLRQVTGTKVQIPSALREFDPEGYKVKGCSYTFVDQLLDL